jgi:hypothetical protein
MTTVLRHATDADHAWRQIKTLSEHADACIRRS